MEVTAESYCPTMDQQPLNHTGSLARTRKSLSFIRELFFRATANRETLFTVISQRPNIAARAGSIRSKLTARSVVSVS